MRDLSLLLVSVALAACAPPQLAAQPPSRACAGSVHAVDGLHEITDDPLVKDALGKPGEGYLCAGKAFEVVQPLVVYRVWQRAKPQTELGRWWSLVPPAGPREAYRAAYAICAEWSPLDVATACRLKVGAHVVVGPGQSATCAASSFAPSPNNQVFVPNDTRDPAKPRVFVYGCSAPAAWPE